MLWNGGGTHEINIIISTLEERPSKDFLEELNQKRIEIIASIVYRVFSNKEWATTNVL